MKYHIAVDLGASSGRVVVAYLDESIIKSTELYRFDNMIEKHEGYLTWNIDYLIGQIMIGLAKAYHEGIRHTTMAIDSWAVDYILLDNNNLKLNPIYCYRDNRCRTGFDKITQNYKTQELFNISGIAVLPFNTLFQLASPHQVALSNAASIMLIPDYINYYLTGVKYSEMSNSSTTGMINASSRTFDQGLLNTLSIDKECFAPLLLAGSLIGRARKFSGLPDIDVIAAASHDTASAVLGAPYAAVKGCAFLSSGTWSLLGCEIAEPIINDLAYSSGYSNEWGGLGGYRFLKNIMGLWLIQEIKKLAGNQYSFSELAEIAEQEEQFINLFDVNSPDLVKPINMIASIEKLCGAPQGSLSIAQAVRASYDSMALSYRYALVQLEQLVGYPITQLNIIGGGSQNSFFNQHIANVTARCVIAGPVEATVMGNIAVQLMATKQVESIEEARHIIKQSSTLQYYHPDDSTSDNYYQKYINKIVRVKNDE